MRVLHVSVSDSYGGAAIAAWRIHDAIRRSGADSRMLVGRKGRADRSVVEQYHGLAGKARLRASQMVEDWILRRQHSPNPILHSLGLLPTAAPNAIAASNPDIINLHWINQATISIGEIARLEKPLVWTLHDTWPFSGCEHYDDMAHPGRFARGYTSNSRAPGHTGSDLDAWNFQRKRKLWQHANITIVTPSRWLGEQSRKSSLFAGRPHHVIPYPIDLDRFRALPKDAARAVLGLGSANRVFSFLGATDDSRKGFDLLAKALWALPEAKRAQLTLLTGGGGALGGLPPGLTVHAVGRLNDEIAINAFHAAADMFCAPSREDNLPLTVMEALASGTPVLAFAVGGMPDMVADGICGALIAPFDTHALAKAIADRIDDGDGNERAAIAARRQAESIFSPQAVADRYCALYRAILTR